MSVERITVPGFEERSPRLSRHVGSERPPGLLSHSRRSVLSQDRVDRLEVVRLPKRSEGTNGRLASAWIRIRDEVDDPIVRLAHPQVRGCVACGADYRTSWIGERSDDDRYVARIGDPASDCFDRRTPRVGIAVVR